MANYFIKAGVSLTSDVKTKVGTIADVYHKATSKKFTVTSGTRSAQSQASAMYTKLAGGDALTIYKDQVSAKAIKAAYDTAVAGKKTKVETIAAIKKVIADQITKKVYISKHLKSGAVDVRSTDMTKTDKAAFKKAANVTATTVILETTPPHWHVQF